MKKLYRKNSVHPSPPVISDHLSFLPAAILALTVALSAADKEVLAYLISCSNSTISGRRKTGRKLAGAGARGGVDHAPTFDCDCFMCYRRYWARWDTSPNRQLIHEIIDAYEDGLAKSKGRERSCRRERRKRNSEVGAGELNRCEVLSLGKGSLSELKDSVQGGGRERSGGDEESGSVRRFVSFVGEKIWSAWG